MYFYVDIKDSSSTTLPLMVDLDIPYDNAWLGSITAEHNLRLINRPRNAPWAFHNSASSSQVDTVQNILIDRSLFNLGLFTGADLINPLPVELLSLSGKVNRNHVNLNWVTALEKNSDYFGIERSVNGKEWTLAGKVKSKGNTNDVSQYAFTDVDALSGQTKLFYRLRITDNDGRFEYSKIVSLSRKVESDMALTVHPNPFDNVLTITQTSASENTVNIELMDIVGKNQQYNTTLTIPKGQHSIVVPTDHLPEGAYLLLIKTESSIKHFKVFKTL